MFISVIVTAYNRSDFLEQAVRSVLNQNLNSDEFEIILVKNFAAPAVDSLASEGYITIIDGGDAPIGVYFTKALRVARGEVISFLDDDDQFEPEKLTRIFHEFQKNPDLVYYRNELELIDSGGSKISHTERNRGLRSDNITIFRTNEEITESDRHVRWNTSCISVRKSVFEGYEEYLPKMTAGQDLTIFFLASAQGGVLEYDPQKLTLYRLHGESVTRKYGPNNDFLREWKSLNGMRYILGDSFLIEEYDRTLSELRIFSIWFGSPASTRELVRLMLSFLQVPRRLYRETKSSILLLTMIFSSLFFRKPVLSLLRKVITPLSTRKTGS